MGRLANVSRRANVYHPLFGESSGVLASSLRFVWDEKQINMEKRSRLVELFHYLQDPNLVARFQHICGVRGTFSRAVSAGSTSGSSKAVDRAHSYNNGSCHRHITVTNESENLAVIGGGEGELVQTVAAGVRKRVPDSNTVNSHDEESQNLPLKVAEMSAATAGGEAVSVGSDACSPAGGTGPGARASESDERGTEKGSQAPDPPASSTLKPLRKNSLTGEAGQEFMIENRFLYYLFTFGTELGNELFYITFFPFLTWNMDAFVSRKLIMVWVWVMYLGQCTKDVIGWSRPASPPVVKVEMFYNSEYSMPSTHAMSGTAIPFSLFFMTNGRWEVQYIHPYLLM